MFFKFDFLERPLRRKDSEWEELLLKHLDCLFWLRMLLQRSNGCAVGSPFGSSAVYTTLLLLRSSYTLQIQDSKVKQWKVEGVQVRPINCSWILQYFAVTSEQFSTSAAPKIIKNFTETLLRRKGLYEMANSNIVSILWCNVIFAGIQEEYCRNGISQ